MPLWCCKAVKQLLQDDSDACCAGMKHRCSQRASIGTQLHHSLLQNRRHCIATYDIGVGLGQSRKTTSKHQQFSSAGVLCCLPTDCPAMTGREAQCHKFLAMRTMKQGHSSVLCRCQPAHYSAYNQGALKQLCQTQCSSMTRLDVLRTCLDCHCATWTPALSATLMQTA